MHVHVTLMMFDANLLTYFELSCKAVRGPFLTHGKEGQSPHQVLIWTDEALSLEGDSSL